MDCVGNLGSTETKLEISASSIVKNGSTDTASILTFVVMLKLILVTLQLQKIRPVSQVIFSEWPMKSAVH